MREQNLVDLKQGPLIIDEQVQKIVSVLARKLRDLHSVLGELCQLKETLLKLFGFIRILIDLLELLLVKDFVLKSAFHNVLSDLFDAFDE